MWKRDRHNQAYEGRMVDGDTPAIEIRPIGRTDSTAVKVTEANVEEMMRRFPTFFDQPDPEPEIAPAPVKRRKSGKGKARS